MIDDALKAALVREMISAIPTHRVSADERVRSYRAALNRVLSRIQDAGLVIEPGWSDDMDAAPRGEPINVYGYSMAGQSSPGGPYRLYITTIGEINDMRECRDLLRPGLDCCIADHIIETPLAWRHRPTSPEGMTE